MSHGPPEPPTITSEPRGVSARRVSDNERFPTGEVVLGVVDDVVGADGSNQVHVSRAAHPGHFRSECLGDLHGERTHASRGTVDQDLLARFDLSLVSKTLQGGER